MAYKSRVHRNRCESTVVIYRAGQRAGLYDDIKTDTLRDAASALKGHPISNLKQYENRQGNPV